MLKDKKLGFVVNI